MRARRLLAIVPALGLLALAGTAMAGNGRPSRIEVVAEFNDAGAILSGNDVRVDGVLAGTVKKIELVDNKAHLTLRLSGDFAPIHRDATVAVRPLSLLGERFVDLDRGSAASPELPDGGLIPASQTRRSVDLDELLSTVDDPTGDGLKSMIMGLGAGMAGNGESAARTLEVIGPALRDTAGLLTILSDQNKLLQELIDRSQPALSALGVERGKKLDALVASTKGLFDTTAAAAPELGETLRRLPGALATARQAFVQLAGLAGDTTPLLASLRPLTSDLSGFANDLLSFAEVAGPALASLDPVLARGKELIDAAQPVVKALAAAGPDMVADAKAGRSLYEQHSPDLANLFDFLRNFALATAGSDGVSHYLRALATSNQENFDGRSPVPVPQAPIFSQPESTKPNPSGVRLGPPAPPKPTAAPAADSGSATGLTVQQERSLLKYLVGGR